jgi:hypothetical protein
VLVISAGYRRIIAEFPHGGGAMWSPRSCSGTNAGVVSGSALLVDYALTITTSLAAAAMRCSACCAVVASRQGAGRDRDGDRHDAAQHARRARIDRPTRARCSCSSS